MDTKAPKANTEPPQHWVTLQLCYMCGLNLGKQVNEAPLQPSVGIGIPDLI